MIINGNIYSIFFPNVLFIIVCQSLVLVFDVYYKCKIIDQKLINSKETKETRLPTSEFCSVMENRQHTHYSS